MRRGVRRKRREGRKNEGKRRERTKEVRRRWKERRSSEGRGKWGIRVKGQKMRGKTRMKSEEEIELKEKQERGGNKIKQSRRTQHKRRRAADTGR